MPKCYQCGTVKLHENFYKDKSRSSGVSSRCKKCSKLPRPRNNKSAKDYRKLYRKLNRERGLVRCNDCNLTKTVSDIYKSKCVDCGELAKVVSDKKKAETLARQKEVKELKKIEREKRIKILPTPKTEEELTERKLRKNILGAQRRALKRGLDFNLEYEKLEYPEYCPVLGIKIEPLTSDRDSSPALDRFDNSKGYTMENVRVISHRANNLKKDATIEEMELILKYMKS